MSSITKKIARLLALANSPYEAEARAAMLKARQMMAEHKLQPEDLEPAQPQVVIRGSSGVTSTKQSTPWAYYLARIIASHYCCSHYLLTFSRRKTCEIAFVGLEDDFTICKQIYRYAHACIMARYQSIQKQKEYDAKERRQMCISYGWGFCQGLQKAYEDQDAQNQAWGLVLTVPKEVTDVVEGMKKITYAKASARTWRADYAALGYQDGRDFDPGHRLGQAAPPEKGR